MQLFFSLDEIFQLIFSYEQYKNTLQNTDLAESLPQYQLTAVIMRKEIYATMHNKNIECVETQHINKHTQTLIFICIHITM